MPRRSPTPTPPPASKPRPPKQPTPADAGRRATGRTEAAAEHADEALPKPPMREPGRAAAAPAPSKSTLRTPSGCRRLEAPAAEPAEPTTAELPHPRRSNRQRCRDSAAAMRSRRSAGEEPKPILIWRPARFDQRPRHRHEARARDGAPAGEARKQGDRQARRDRRSAEAAARRRRRAAAVRQAALRAQVRRQAWRRSRRRAARRQGRRPPQGRRQWRQDGGRRASAAASGAKSWTTQKPREERPVRVDPDSPFAKLAALRDQLKK